LLGQHRASPESGGAAVSNVIAGVVQRVSANRVEYQHNRKVETDDKGRVTRISAPIDISFESDDHSEYFARERKESQLAGLRTVRWEMDDDWWAAAKYHAYQGKEPDGRAWKKWYEKIESSHGKRMAASDGHSLSTHVKKSAPHFDEKWEPVLNAAIIKGTGKVYDTEAEMRGIKEERKEKAERERSNKESARIAGIPGASTVGIAWDDNPNDTWECTKAEADAQGLNWKLG